MTDRPDLAAECLAARAAAGAAPEVEAALREYTGNVIDLAVKTVTGGMTSDIMKRREDAEPALRLAITAAVEAARREERDACVQICHSATYDRNQIALAIRSRT